MYIGFFLRKFQMPQKIPFVLIVNLPLMKPNPAAVMFNFKAEQFEYFFSLFSCLQWNFIFLLFSDLKDSLICQISPSAIISIKLIAEIS